MERPRKAGQSASSLLTRPWRPAAYTTTISTSPAGSASCEGVAMASVWAAPMRACSARPMPQSVITAEGTAIEPR